VGEKTVWLPKENPSVFPLFLVIILSEVEPEADYEIALQEDAPIMPPRDIPLGGAFVDLFYID
jgi:hypothetical protein